MSTPLPEVNELALRLAARVLRRDVDGMPRALPDPTHPADELKALARDIETFADLVVARIGSTRWELERAEKQLRVQDGEIEELQSKLVAERSSAKLLAQDLQKADRRGAAAMRERAARTVDDQASNEKSVPAFQTLEEAAARIRALPLTGAAREDDTAPETPAARGAVQPLVYRCMNEHCPAYRQPSGTPGRCSACSDYLVAPDARARQASAGARAVAAMEGAWRYFCENKDCKTYSEPRTGPGNCYACGHEIVHRPAVVPPPAPENLPEAPAARYICENEGCGYKGSRDAPQRPGLCPHCKCELTARHPEESLAEAPAVRYVCCIVPCPENGKYKLSAGVCEGCSYPRQAST